MVQIGIFKIGSSEVGTCQVSGTAYKARKEFSRFLKSGPGMLASGVVFVAYGFQDLLRTRR